MQDCAIKQIKSSEVQNRITGNLELTQLLSKTAQDIEERILGTQTPWDTASTHVYDGSLKNSLNGQSTSQKTHTTKGPLLSQSS